MFLNLVVVSQRSEGNNYARDEKSLGLVVYTLFANALNFLIVKDFFAKRAK
jgi:hypothetical protein